MSKPFLTNIDMMLNQLLQVRLENLASAPGHSMGREYFDTTLGYARISDGTTWERASFDLDPYARGNHSGTQTAATISDLATVVQAYRLDQFAVPTADLNLNNRKLTNVANGTSAGDAVTRAQLDAVSVGLDIKPSQRVASTANVAGTYTATGGASGRGQFTAMPNTIDGVALAATDRVLLKDQATGAQNGLWVVTTLGTGANGVWDRAPEFDSDAEVSGGAFVFIEEGTVNADSGWVLTTNNPIVIGGGAGTALVWAQFSGAGQIIAGTGLTKTGNTLNAGAGTGILVNADDIAINPAVVVRKFATNVGDGAAVFYVVTHNLNTQDVIVGVYDNTTPFAEVECDVEHTSVNTITLRFAVAPAAAKYRCVVQA